jgi:hypothetical protein
MPAEEAEEQASDQEAREFAVAFRRFLDWVHSGSDGTDNEVSVLVRGHLGDQGQKRSVVTRELPRFEQVNLQTALNAWSARPGRTVDVRGVAMPPHYGGLSLQQLVAGEALPPLQLTAPALADLPNGPDSTLPAGALAGPGPGPGRSATVRVHPRKFARRPFPG